MGAVTTLGLGLAAGLVGGAAGFAACSVDRRASTGDCALGAALVGGALGAGVGLPLGVWWGGRLTEGRGSFWGAFGGFSAGLALGGGALLLEQFDLGRGLLLASPLLAVVGYELSHANTQPQASPAVGISPTLGLGPGGGSLGLQGRF
ncbi:MAG TPA: hypothetical protein VE153_22390 [Myxococcus sp.]|nr:hypothetical protein [Myxococcus sp.]